jgi:threonine/homoserine/homoserine lactone efflux protein
MTLSFLLKGLLIGLTIAAPVGPIGILTIRKTLAEGRLAGFMTGLGAACADAVYGAIAGFGLTIVSSFLIEHEFWMQLFGGLFLVYLGVKSYRSIPATEAAKISGKGLINNLVSTFFLTATNPATILLFASVFTAFGIGSEPTDYGLSGVLVLGVFLGSALWWLTLSTAVGFLRGQITPNRLLWINRTSGILITGFGLWFLLGLFMK